MLVSMGALVKNIKIKNYNYKYTYINPETKTKVSIENSIQLIISSKNFG